MWYYSEGHLQIHEYDAHKNSIVHLRYIIFYRTSTSQYTVCTDTSFQYMRSKIKSHLCFSSGNDSNKIGNYALQLFNCSVAYIFISLANNSDRSSTIYICILICRVSSLNEPFKTQFKKINYMSRTDFYQNIAIINHTSNS